MTKKLDSNELLANLVNFIKLTTSTTVDNESSYDEELIDDCSSAFIHAIAWRDIDTIEKILFKFFDFDNNDAALSFEDFLKKHGFQIIEGSHPGEGSGENHYFIARVGEVYYKVEYNYYSYQGYSYQGLEFSKNDMIIVYPQQVMTTIFLETPGNK